MLILITLLAYFGILLTVSRLTARHADNNTFFRGERRSPWPLVAFGMVGASISGVTFISVPGMVLHSQMTYVQTCLGFILGYVVVAAVLLPVYYGLGLTTIYGYLHQRLGKRAYRTGAAFFLLSKMTGAAVRFYVVCALLHRFVLGPAGIPFVLTVAGMMSLIWLYTRHGGIKTLVWTDTFQTTCLLAALLLIIYKVAGELDMSMTEAMAAVARDERSHMFVWDDWMSRQNFWKQFLSGVFIVVVMTGLDQDMMQKNLTCKTLREAQKDMCCYGLAFVPVNVLFMSLGVLLCLLATRQGMPLPQVPDELLPIFAASGRLGNVVVVLFTVGIVAASFSSADSALTAMTTTFCVDICQQPDDEQLRHRTHLAMAAVFVLVILAVDAVNSTSVIDAIYILCSYTYGPLLGLFAFALLTDRRLTRDHVVPYLAVLSPIVCYLLNVGVAYATDYRFGYELLMLNGALTFAGLFACSAPGKSRFS